MLTVLSSCYEADVVLDCGFNCCTSCGKVVQRELDTTCTSYNACWGTVMNTTPYTRSSRFNTKILAALLGNVNHRCDAGLLRWLHFCNRKNRLATPEMLLKRISDYKTTIRKPYIHSRCYWIAVKGGKLPTISNDEVVFIEKTFAELFYAWERLNLKKPKFPFTTALRLIVEKFELSDNMKYLCRFARKLRCPNRKKRYKENFEKCVAYIQTHAERTGWRRLQTSEVYQEP